jgi:uncharacterized protein YjbI with pentapeptide repeats
MKNEENNPSKCPNCGRPTHRESKYCIFHASAEEKTEKEFKKALKEYIKRIEEENKSYNFKKFIFIGYIDFTNVVFKNRYTSFWGAIFQGDVDFPGTAFIGYSIFFETTFKGNVSFIGTDFQGSSDFRKATFKGNVNFYHATFEGDAHFEETTFKGDADFRKVKSLLLNNFMGATFEGDTDFGNAIFSPGNKLNLKVKESGIISFEHTFLENVFLDLNLDDRVLIDFTDALLRNTKTKKKQIENHILQEKREKFYEAQEIFLLLKNNFHSIGQYGDESWAFKKEKDMERKSNCHFKTLHKWIWSCFLNAIYGYGEKPERVFLSAILIILFFTCIFMNYGITSPPLDNLPKYNILKELSMGILYGDLLKKFISIPWEQLKNCIYFSTVTFTTLGLGDFTPVESWGRIFVGLEAFIGAFMMALFVYTFARRTGGK